MAKGCHRALPCPTLPLSSFPGPPTLKTERTEALITLAADVHVRVKSPAGSRHSLVIVTHDAVRALI